MKQIIRRVAALVIGLGLGAVALAGLETVTHISDLNASWPLGSDLASTSDDHIRNIKTALKTDFPNVNGAVNPTPAQFNQLTTNTFTSGVTVSSGNVTVSSGNVSVTGSVTANSLIPSSSTVPSNGLYLPSANTIGLSSATTARGSINSTGNWIVNAPSSGITLTVNGVSSSTIASFEYPTSSNSGAFVRFVDTTNGLTRGLIGSGSTLFSGASVSDFGISSVGSGSLRLGYSGGSVSSITIGSSGNVTLSAPSSGAALSISGATNSNTLSVSGNSTTGQSFGVAVSAGTNSSDYSELVQSTGGTSYFKIRGDGQISGGGTVAATLVDMTPDTGTFTATYTGMTATITCTATWSRIGKLVSLFFCAATGTSNATSFTMTGLPSAIQPASLTQWVPLAVGPVQNGGTIETTGAALITASSGTITFEHTGSASGWTSSGVKGFSAGATISYLLN